MNVLQDIGIRLRPHVRILKDGLLCQDFETLDGKVKVETTRSGGGFSVGVNTYHIYKDEAKVLQTAVYANALAIIAEHVGIA